MIKTLASSLATLAVLGLSFSPAYAAERAEVMTLSGTATLDRAGSSRALAQGDLIEAGDVLDVPAGSYVDLAYDKAWKNVTRLSGPTKLEVVSIHPTGLQMERGDVFAHLKQLPKNSTFEVQTPSGVAAVRGSALRTTHDDEKGTNVYNFSDSPVEVFDVDAEGRITGSPEVLEKFEKSAVGEEGPTPPAPMTDDEKNAGAGMQTGLLEEIKEAEAEGRESALDPIETIEREYAAAFEERVEAKAESTETTSLKTDGAVLPAGETDPKILAVDSVLKQTESSMEKMQTDQERHEEKTSEETKEGGETATSSGRQTVHTGP